MVCQIKERKSTGGGRGGADTGKGTEARSDVRVHRKKIAEGQDPRNWVKMAKRPYYIYTSTVPCRTSNMCSKRRTEY